MERENPEDTSRNDSLRVILQEHQCMQAQARPTPDDLMEAEALKEKINFQIRFINLEIQFCLLKKPILRADLIQRVQTTRRVVVSAIKKAPNKEDEDKEKILEEVVREALGNVLQDLDGKFLDNFKIIVRIQSELAWLRHVIDTELEYFRKRQKDYGACIQLHESQMSDAEFVADTPSVALGAWTIMDRSNTLHLEQRIKPYTALLEERKKQLNDYLDDGPNPEGPDQPPPGAGMDLAA